MSKLIYIDNAATTQVYPEVLDTMIPYFTEHYGNPSAIYSFAGEAKRGVDHARETIANVIGAKTEEIYFTGGGSESDNWALKATAEAYANKGKHIITTTIEHHAILHTAQWLEKKGYEITYVNVDEDGKVKLDELEAKMSQTFDPDQRAELAIEMQQTVLDDHAFVYCSFLKMSMISRANVSNYTSHACDYYQVTADLDIQ